MTNEIKNVPELRFPEFNEQWEIKKLADLGYYGKNYSFSRASEGVGDIRHVHYGDIHSKLPTKINDENLLPTIVENKNFEFVECGDIIFADASEDYKDLGKTVLVDILDSKIIAGLHTYLFKVNKGSASEFLINVTKTQNYRKFIKQRGTGISVLGISKTNLASFSLYVPSYREQKKIGSFFSKLDRQIELEEQKLEKLEEQKKGYMQQIFSQQLRFKDEDGSNYLDWSIKELKEILTPGNKEKIEDKSIYNRLTVGLHGKGVFHLEQERKTKDTRPFYQRYEGELIIGKQNFFNGSIAIIPKEFNGYICSNAIMSYKFKDNINSKYVLEYLLQNDFLRKNEFLADGTGQKELSEKNFEVLKINIPNSTEEQQKIGDFFKKIDELIETQSSKVELLKGRKQGFLQKMFI